MAVYIEHTSDSRRFNIRVVVLSRLLFGSGG